MYKTHLQLGQQTHLQLGQQALECFRGDENLNVALLVHVSIKIKSCLKNVEGNKSNNVNVSPAGSAPAKRCTV